MYHSKNSFFIFRSTIVGLATVKRDKYSVFDFLNFSAPTQYEQTEGISQQEQSHNPPKDQQEGGHQESKVEKELNKSKSMKSIFSHLVETDIDTQKSTKPVSFSMKSNKSNKPKEFKSIFSHLETEDTDSVKLMKSAPVAMETENEGKKSDETKKDKNSDLQKKIIEKVRHFYFLENLLKISPFLLGKQICCCLAKGTFEVND